ncbi:MAG: GreA/GreB family elongation factor [Patescibacteria group bacterium]
MSTIKFIQKGKTKQKNVGRIADRLQLAMEKNNEARRKLTELLEMGKAVLETAEYAEARMEVLYWQKRVDELRKLFNIGYKRSAGQVVGLGSTVKVRYGAVNKEYTIVTSLEADPANGYISENSPLGRALLNKKASDDVSVRAPSGNFVYTIESVV